MMDEVRTVSFPKTVATVYVGNPAIADINMIDSRHAFVMGKGYGSTNIVALDQDGKQVSNIPISVLARQNATVTLQVAWRAAASPTAAPPCIARRRRHRATTRPCLSKTTPN